MNAIHPEPPEAASAFGEMARTAGDPCRTLAMSAFSDTPSRCGIDSKAGAGNQEGAEGAGGGGGRMFISWGGASVARTFGEPVNQYCPTCEKDRIFRQSVSYKVRHVLWIFRWVTGKKYTLACDVCRRGEPLNAAEVESQRRKHVIPFMDRMGWAVGLAILAVFIGWVAWVEQANRKRDIAFLAAPAVGDIYEINLAQMARPPKTDQEYSLMRVAAVSGNSVQVRLSQRYCNKFGCASSDVTNGKAKSDDYYGGEIYSFPLSELTVMRSDGRIIAVDR